MSFGRADPLARSRAPVKDLCNDQRPLHVFNYAMRIWIIAPVRLGQRKVEA